MAMKKGLLLGLGIWMMAGCSPMQPKPVVLPLEKNHYEIVVQWSDKHEALKAAMDKANKICAAKGLEAYVLTHDSEYHGVDQNAKTIIRAVEDVAFFSGDYTGPSANLDSNNDYSVKLRFKCDR